MKSKPTHTSQIIKTDKDSKKTALFWQIFIALTTLIFYLPSFTNGFVNWDDDIYIFNNPYIHSLSSENLKNIFTSYYNGNYHPLTMLSYAIDYAFTGTNPFLYHFINVLIHILNTLLAFSLVKKLFSFADTRASLTIPAVSSLLFGIHPFHVESVSWVSERKDVLYTFFFLLALIFYIRYLKEKKISFYILTVLVFLVSLLSKGMAVSFAVTIFAVDFALERKLFSTKVLLEKIPFLMISLIFGLIAIRAQKSENAIITGNFLDLTDKISFASYAFVQYLIKIFVPYGLVHYYPYPVKIGDSFPSFYYLFPFILILGLASMFYFFRKSRIVLFGLFFFIINIVLVLKLIPVGDVIMADRYSYLSSIGIFILIALFFNSLLIRYNKSQNTIITLFSIYFLVLGCMTFQRTKVWKDTFSLWSDAYEKYPDNAVIVLNRGLCYEKTGDLDLALKDYYRSLEIDPDYDKAYTDIGNVMLSKGDLPGAIKQYDKAISLNKNNEKAFNNRGKAKIDLGEYNEALYDLNTAITLAPTYTDAFQNRGAAKYLMKKYDDAIQDFNYVIQLDPNYALAYYVRGLCYFNQNKKDVACSDLQKAVDLKLEVAINQIGNICK